MFLRFVEFSDEKRPCGAGAVDLSEDGRTGTGHPGAWQGSGARSRGDRINLRQNWSRRIRPQVQRW